MFLLYVLYDVSWRIYICWPLAVFIYFLPCLIIVLIGIYPSLICLGHQDHDPDSEIRFPFVDSANPVMALVCAYIVLLAYAHISYHATIAT